MVRVYRRKIVAIVVTMITAIVLALWVNHLLNKKHPFSHMHEKDLLSDMKKRRRI